VFKVPSGLAIGVAGVGASRKAWIGRVGIGNGSGHLAAAAPTQLDERGSVCEIYSPAWGFTDEPVVWLYETRIRPGQIKGWVLHLEQDDRLFFSTGDIKAVLYDARPGSPTSGRLNVRCFGDMDRALLRIPAGVYHALQNVGDRDAVFLNLPTQPYRHEEPDKYRLPLDTPEIPYTF
jgi:dTDP-4-dehydrorhamnose 3,5-epimerase